MKTKLLLLDWNGTLLDDYHVWYASMKAVFDHFKIPPPTGNEYFRRLRKDYVENYHSFGVRATREEMNAIYTPVYNRLVSTAKIFPHVQETLSMLQKMGFQLGLVTMQPEELAMPLLEAHKLAGLLKHNHFHCKDKALAIGEVLDLEGISPMECCFCGDTPSDILQGEEAGVRTAAFVPGHISLDVFNECQPMHLFTNFRQLLRLAN